MKKHGFLETMTAKEFVDCLEDLGLYSMAIDTMVSTIENEGRNQNEATDKRMGKEKRQCLKTRCQFDALTNSNYCATHQFPITEVIETEFNWKWLRRLDNFIEKWFGDQDYVRPKAPEYPPEHYQKVTSGEKNATVDESD